MEEIIEFFKHHKVKCVKYKYCVTNPESRDQQCYDSFMQMSSDGYKLNFTKKEVIVREYRPPIDDDNFGIQTIITSAQRVFRRKSKSLCKLIPPGVEDEA